MREPGTRSATTTGSAPSSTAASTAWARPPSSSNGTRPSGGSAPAGGSGRRRRGRRRDRAPVPSAASRADGRRPCRLGRDRVEGDPAARLLDNNHQHAARKTMTERIEVLDHGYIAIVDTWGTDERIVE